MVDVVYRFGSEPEGGERRPATAGRAQQLLESGNRDFSRLFDPDRDPTSPAVITVAAGDLGFDAAPGGILAHEPFAAVVGCADARVPIELVFGRAVNDLFVLRVAGNVLGAEVIGSLDYAFQNLPSLRLVVVLGHTSCGAVTAAVDAYLNPASYLGLSAEHQLRAIVDQLFPAIRLGHAAMLRNWGPDAAGNDGFVAALVDTSIALNAAIMASSLRSELAGYGLDEVASRFGVYDLGTHGVGAPAEGPDGGRLLGLTEPPGDAEGFTALADAYTRGPVVSASMDA
jgi:carbonic anhydrase